MPHAVLFLKPSTLLRRDVGSQAWFSQYMGVPRAPEGNRFKRNWFPIFDPVDGAAMIATRCRYWDKAGTAGGGCFTAGVLMARADDGFWYIEDVDKSVGPNLGHLRRGEAQ